MIRSGIGWTEPGCAAGWIIPLPWPPNQNSKYKLFKNVYLF